MHNNTPPIHIIDSLPSTGKSNYIISQLQAQPQTKTLVVVPYLDEVERYLKSLPHFKTPDLKSKSKQDTLLSLLVEGHSIVITHSLYQLLSDLHREAIDLMEYHLVLNDIKPLLYPAPFNCALFLAKQVHIFSSEVPSQMLVK